MEEENRWKNKTALNSFQLSSGDKIVLALEDSGLLQKKPLLSIEKTEWLTQRSTDLVGDWSNNVWYSYIFHLVNKIMISTCRLQYYWAWLIYNFKSKVHSPSFWGLKVPELCVIILLMLCLNWGSCFLLFRCFEGTNSYQKSLIWDSD